MYTSLDFSGYFITNFLIFQVCKQIGNRTKEEENHACKVHNSKLMIVMGNEVKSSILL